MPAAELLAGKVAFITGSTRGIGWATAELFAEHGATLVLNSRANRDRLEECVADLHKRFGVPVNGLLCDVANPKAVRGAFQEIFKAQKRLDVLVNNAGILDDALLGMISTEAADRTFATNALSVLHCMQFAARLMARNRAGSIVNLSSIIGVTGNAGQVAYAGSKAAVLGMSRSAAKELASTGIRVNAVAPGFIDTDMARQLPPEKFQERLASIKMGRIGSPREVASVILFLASDLSTYVTGQVIGVDGGMLI